MKQPEVKAVGLKVMFMTSALLAPQQKAAAWKIPALLSGWTKSVMSEDDKHKSICIWYKQTKKTGALCGLLVRLTLATLQRQ